MPEEIRSSYDRWDQKPALGRRGMVLAVLVPVLLAATAFGVVSWVSRDTESTASAVKVPTSDWIPGQPAGSAPIRGALAIDDQECVYLDGADGRIWPIWPAGYRALSDDSGHVSLYDGDNRLVARQGEDVQASGTLDAAGAHAGKPCVPADGDVAVVQSDVTRVG